MKLSFPTFLAGLLTATAGASSPRLHMDKVAESDAKASVHMPPGKGFSAVYGMSNADVNEVIVWSRNTNTGALAFEARVPTGGAGGGVAPATPGRGQVDPLGSQDPILVAGRCLLAVNPGSNTITSFKITGPSGIVSAGVYDTNGVLPVSIAERYGLVYVLNAGINGSIQGYHLSSGNGCQLTPIGGAVELFQGDNGAFPNDPPFGPTSPAQIGFTPDGDILVTIKVDGGGQNFQGPGLGSINHYAIADDGSTSAEALTKTVVSRPVALPFAFDFDASGRLLLNEVFINGFGAPPGGMSIWHESNGSYSEVADAVPVDEPFSCWLRFNHVNECAYLTNSGAVGSISSVSTAGGTYALVESVAATLNGPLDLVFSDDSEYLYVMSPGFSDGTMQPQLYVYEAGSDCGLTEVQAIAEGYESTDLDFSGPTGVAIYPNINNP